VACRDALKIRIPADWDWDRLDNLARAGQSGPALSGLWLSKVYVRSWLAQEYRDGQRVRSSSGRDFKWAMFHTTISGPEEGEVTED
jgi:hypothetical protein